MHVASKESRTPLPMLRPNTACPISTMASQQCIGRRRHLRGPRTQRNVEMRTADRPCTTDCMRTRISLEAHEFRHSQ
eukprot:110417-Amphidinium_carterae.1